MNVNFKSSVGQGKSLFFGKSNDGKKTLFKKVPPPPTWDIGITTTSSNQTFSINIVEGISPNINVNWGDGTVETFNTTGVKTRTYASAGSYIVKISGSFASGGNIRLGNTGTEKARIKSTSVIPIISGLTSLNSAFSFCPSLTSIPAGLFDNNTAVKSFDGTFYNCTSLTSIPAGLFDNNTAVTIFNFAFHGCTSLTSIPAGLFDNNTAVTRFDGIFYGCTSLTSIPSGLFANNTVVTNFASVFFGVTLTTTSYSNLLINMASNAASRRNNVQFDGGNSKYNLNGQTARQILQAKNWSFSDGGLE
jgi:hypothetical protein